jgi:hypothetical protein
MLFYAEHISSRLRYVVDFVSKSFFHEPIRITDNREEYSLSAEPRINYSAHPITAEEFWIKPVDLLFQKGISNQSVTCFNYNNNIVFFSTSAGDLPFDIFAAIFYLLSRYEEYLPSDRDACGRYLHTNSLAFQNQFLNVPLINCWLKDLRKTLAIKFPEVHFSYTSFKFIPTYNIDRAYAYVKEGWKQEATTLVKSLLKGDWNAVTARQAVLNGKTKDPYDAYEWLDALHLYCRLKPHYFFLVASENNNYDTNIAPSHPRLEQLIEYYATTYKIGIHPSWQSGDKEQLLKEEIEWLEYIADRKVIHSRQHYTRMTLPDTYRKLIKYGIEKDHSMGYGTINGFRASVASSFYWYDLEKEEATSLLLFPFCFTDTNAFYHEKLNAPEAFEQLMNFFNIIKSVNGLMITTWHNHFLGTDPRFAGWKEVYEIFLKDEIYWER